MSDAVRTEYCWECQRTQNKRLVQTLDQTIVTEVATCPECGRQERASWSTAEAAG